MSARSGIRLVINALPALALGLVWAVPGGVAAQDPRLPTDTTIAVSYTHLTLPTITE